jgi:hypothetical protein
LSDILPQDEDFFIIKNLFDSISISSSEKIKKRIKIMEVFFIISIAMVIISVFLNFIIIFNIIFFLIPVIIISMLLLIMQTPIGSKNSLTELKNLILISYDTIIYEYSQLLQFKIEGSEEYFGLIEQQIKKLKIFIDHLKELNIEKVENKIKSIIFINDNFENIKYPIEKIYEIRGMFSNLMSILLKIRENQISNFKKNRH